MENAKFHSESNGQYGAIIYTLSPNESIVNFDNGMITNNNIKGIIGYIHEKNNGKQLLFYNISRGVKFSLMRCRKLNRSIVLSVLDNIASILLLAREYMLDERRFVFDDEYIFVDTTSYDVSLIYVPTDGYTGLSFVTFIKDCMINGIFNDNEDLVYPMQILNYINSNPNVTVDDLKKFFQSLLVKEPTPVASKPTAVQQIVQNREPQAPTMHSNAVSVPIQASMPPTAPVKDGGKKKISFFGGKKTKVERPEKNRSSFNMNIPGMNNMSAASIPSAPVIRGENNQTGSLRHNETVAQERIIPAQPFISEINDNGDKTVFMQAGDDTITNGDTVNGYLVNDRGERVHISKSGFVVGKESESGVKNDYNIKNKSVSRMHAIFTIRESRFYITDASSLNGTFVNGKKIGSNVEIELYSNDSIRFSDEKYTFIIE